MKTDKVEIVNPLTGNLVKIEYNKKEVLKVESEPKFCPKCKKSITPKN